MYCFVNPMAKKVITRPASYLRHGSKLLQIGL